MSVWWEGEVEIHCGVFSSHVLLAVRSVSPLCHSDYHTHVSFRLNVTYSEDIVACVVVIKASEGNVVESRSIASQLQVRMPTCSCMREWQCGYHCKKETSYGDSV